MFCADGAVFSSTLNKLDSDKILSFKMALPKAHGTAETARLQAFVMKQAPEAMGLFPILRRTDMQVIGSYIQLFNYIDMHLRRCLEIFARNNMLPESTAKKYTRIPASKLTSTLRPVIEAMDASSEEINLALLHLDGIDAGRPIRNLLAHWAGRRIPNEDAIVLLTKSESDAEQSGYPLNAYGAATAILLMQDLRERLSVIGSYENWLALKTGEWFKRYVSNQSVP